MRTTFERFEGFQRQRWDRMIDDLRNTLEAFRSGNIDEEGAYEFLVSHISCQDESGAWGLIDPNKAPSDARVDYYYIPTYLSTAILMRAYYDYPAVTERIEGFMPAFRKALQASTGRFFRGHGYDELGGILEALRIFYDGGAAILMTDTELCPSFSEVLHHSLVTLEESKREETIKSTWTNDYSAEISGILCKYYEDITVLFVYGTLMNGQPNHDAYLSGARSLGEARLDDYALFDLGPYPAILPRKGACVLGELYLVTRAQLARIDALEAEGSLYHRRKVETHTQDKHINTETYIYHKEIDESHQIPFICQPWGNKNYVWYACYGSNLLQERFMEYLIGGESHFTSRSYARCVDSTPPQLSIPLTFPYELYFGNQSRAWENGGVAFLDKDITGNTLGKAYLISTEQYKHLRNQEGRSSNWYDSEISLGTKYGIQIRTITNHQRREANAPSDAYREVIIRGLLETYSGMRREEEVLSSLFSERKQFPS